MPKARSLARAGQGRVVTHIFLDLKLHDYPNTCAQGPLAVLSSLMWTYLATSMRRAPWQ
jgi:orotidine-5'-phosphate decarboxylase